MKNKITVYIIACVLLGTPTLNFGMDNPLEIMIEQNSNTPDSRSLSPVRSRSASPHKQSSPIFIINEKFSQLNSDDQSDSDSLLPILNMETGSVNHSPRNTTDQINGVSSPKRSGSTSPAQQPSPTLITNNQLDSDNKKELYKTLQQLSSDQNSVFYDSINPTTGSPLSSPRTNTDQVERRNSDPEELKKALQILKSDSDKVFGTDSNLEPDSPKDTINNTAPLTELTDTQQIDTDKRAERIDTILVALFADNAPQTMTCYEGVLVNPYLNNKGCCISYKINDRITQFVDIKASPDELKSKYVIIHDATTNPPFAIKLPAQQLDNNNNKSPIYMAIGVTTLAAICLILAYRYNKDAFIKLLNSILPNRCAL